MPRVEEWGQLHNGHMGFHVNLHVIGCYRLVGAIYHIKIIAKTDALTLGNLINHTFFSLSPE